MRTRIDIYYKDGRCNYDASLLEETEDYFKIIPRSYAEVYFAMKKSIASYRTGGQTRRLE